MPNADSRAFTLGLILGAGGGLVVGSLLGLQLGEKTLTWGRRIADRILRHQDRVRFELLLQ